MIKKNERLTDFFMLQLGDSTDNMEPQLKPKGVGSDHYDENIASQKTNQVCFHFLSEY